MKELKDAGNSEKLANAIVAAEEAKKAFLDAENDLKIAEERIKIALDDLKTVKNKEAEDKAQKELKEARENRDDAKKAELEAIDNLKDAQDDKVKAQAEEPLKESSSAEETEAMKQAALKARELAIEKEHKGKLDLENATNKIDEAKAKMLIREAKQEKIEASLALKRAAVNAVRDEQIRKFKEVEEEGNREIERAEKGLPPTPDAPVPEEKTAKTL